MADEVSVSAILIEAPGKGFRADCPELGLDVRGKDSEEAFENLKAAIKAHIKEKGAGNIRLNYVKCTKIKVLLK
ncbi:MAG: hypothetical protein HY883_00095 [Deltaproteobacteria bacterium]|nr:hypothetical protein [Deltaproteobacteria bacterium]